MKEEIGSSLPSVYGYSTTTLRCVPIQAFQSFSFEGLASVSKDATLSVEPFVARLGVFYDVAIRHVHSTNFSSFTLFAVGGYPRGIKIQGLDKKKLKRDEYEVRNSRQLFLMIRANFLLSEKNCHLEPYIWLCHKTESGFTYYHQTKYHVSSFGYEHTALGLTSFDRDNPTKACSITQQSDRDDPTKACFSCKKFAFLFIMSCLIDQNAFVEPKRKACLLLDLYTFVWMHVENTFEQNAM